MSSNRIKSNKIQMGNNYVLPIEQSNVTMQQAKVKQIIEETDIKVQQIIEDAENKSGSIVKTANSEAEKIIAEARKKAEQEYESIKQKAYEEGFTKGEQDGLEKFKNDSIEALKSLDVLVSSSFESKKNIIDSATIDIVELVAAIADKVCHAKFDAKTLYRITLDAIKKLNDNSEKFDIIYLDPPYGKNIVIKALNYMHKYDILNEDGIIVAETDASDIVDDVVGDFFKYDERKYGRVRIHFFRKAR